MLAQLETADGNSLGSSGFAPTPKPIRFSTFGRILSWDRLIRLVGHVLTSLPPSTWLIVDVTTMAFGVFLGFTFIPPPELDITPHLALWQAVMIFSFAVILMSLVFGLYERETVTSRSRIAARLFLTAGTATVIAYAIIYIIMYSTVSRRITLTAMSFFVVSTAGIRICACCALHGLQRRLLVVGTRGLLESFERAQSLGLLHGYKLEGFVTTESSGPQKNDPTCLGTIQKITPGLSQRGVTDIVVATESAGDAQAMSWVVPCLQQGCRVTNEAIFYEKATGQILADQITPSWFLFADLKVHCEQQATLKRVADLSVAALGLVVTSPVWLLVGLAVKLCDGGPIFYSQERVGQNGSIFRLHKFRSMHPNAENGKSVWAAPNDPRVTKVGRILRRTRLDELPQLWDVLVGHMSLVGPRPERPDIVDDLRNQIPFYNERHLVKPGVTGWAQISYKYGSTIEDAKRKLQFDLYYLKGMSFELDMIILFRTLGTFLRGAC